VEYAIFFALIGYIAAEIILGGGLFAREDFRYASGIHWYAIEIFLLMFLAYMIRDRVGLIYLPALTVVYYAIHEAQFNLFFLAYHAFQIPLGVNWTWYLEIIVDVIICSGIAALLISSPKWRAVLLRSSSARIAGVLWISVICFYFVWMLAGFPVSINVFDLKDYGFTNHELVANEFELGVNVLFSASFYFTFLIGGKRELSPHGTEKVPETKSIPAGT